MKKLILILGLIISILSVRGQETYNLWPDGAPDDNGNDNIASVTVYHPQGVKTDKAAVICPGGAYQYLASEHEGHMIARLLADNGVTALVLKYRLPHGHDLIPARDARQAIKLVRNNAKEWGVNPGKVGIIGSSAGGHLASTVSTHLVDSMAIPDFAVLLYPVISLKPDITHQGSAENLLGERVGDNDAVSIYSNEEHVTSFTPSTLLLLSGDDTTVPVENSLRYYKALIDNGVPAEMHVYPIGGHGWGMMPAFRYHDEMTATLLRYIHDL